MISIHPYFYRLDERPVLFVIHGMTGVPKRDVMKMVCKSLAVWADLYKMDDDEWFFVMSIITCEQQRNYPSSTSRMAEEVFGVKEPLLTWKNGGSPESRTMNFFAIRIGVGFARNISKDYKIPSDEACVTPECIVPHDLPSDAVNSISDIRSSLPFNSFAMEGDNRLYQDNGVGNLSLCALSSYTARGPNARYYTETDGIRSQLSANYLRPGVFDKLPSQTEITVYSLYFYGCCGCGFIPVMADHSTYKLNVTLKLLNVRFPQYDIVFPNFRDEGLRLIRRSDCYSLLVKTEELNLPVRLVS